MSLLTILLLTYGLLLAIVLAFVAAAGRNNRRCDEALRRHLEDLEEGDGA
jgi:hypothetical protein